MVALAAHIQPANSPGLESGSRSAAAVSIDPQTQGAFTDRLEGLIQRAQHSPNISPGAVVQAANMFDSQNAAYLDNPALHGHRRMPIWDSLLTRPHHLAGALVASLVAYHAQCPFSGKQESRPEVLPSADIAIKIMQDLKTSPEARELALFTQFFRPQTKDDLRALAQCIREIDGRGEITPIQTAFAQRFTIPLSGGNN